MTLKIRFYFIKKKTTIMHNIYIYIYTHKNSQLLRWYAMILIYSKSGILLQLHFLWSLNSNLQIIVNYCLREKISTTTLCAKTKSIQELKVLIHFILDHHHLQSKKLSTSTIEHFSHYGCPQVSEKERMTPKVCQFPSKYIYTPFMGVSDLVKQPNANGKQKTYLYCMLHLEALLTSNF